MFDLKKKAHIGIIVLRFDTTERFWSDMYNSVNKRAADRLVRDYDVEIFADGEWHTEISEKDNYLRCRRYETDVFAEKVRINVRSVWGGGSARIYEIQIISS